MTTVEVCKSIAKGNVKKGQEILAAFKMPPARNENEMIVGLNRIISENQREPEVLKTFIKCMPAYFEPQYTPCNGGECKCGSNSADGYADDNTPSKSKIGGFLKDNSTLLIGAATLIVVATILTK